MAKVNIKIKGLQELQQKLNEKKQAVENTLNMLFPELGEKAVVFSKDNKGYMDRTANLKNSISFAVFHDGKLLTTQIGQIPEPERIKKGQSQVQNALDEYALRPGVVAPKGYTIIVVAGMEYGKYVEDKGYNVLYLTKNFLKDGMKDIFDTILEEIKK